MKKWSKRILGTIVGVLALLVFAFMIWAQFDYDASQQAVSYVETETPREVTFGKETSDVGFIFYQGAKVDAAAYSYYGNQLAKDGHFVIIPKLPFRIALLDANEGLDIIEEYPQVKRWYLMGHSLGGSAASTIVEQNPKIKGIIFLASYPIDSIDVPSLTIYGGRDGVLPVADIEKSKQDVRKDAIFHEIKQGNHANFGMYGPQKGDNSSPLTPKEQQNESLDEIKRFIDAP